MVPLDERHTVLDWMIEIDLPLILVVGSYVGTLSHTLSALDVLDRHDLKVLAVVVSESAGSAVSLDDTAATIRRFATGIEVLAVPRLSSEAADHPAMAPIAHLM
jgi:dethiobiotin synthetase